MTRFVANRAFMVFLAVAVFSAASGLAAPSAVAEAVFLVSGAMAALLGGAMLAPVPARVPVRARRRR